MRQADGFLHRVIDAVALVRRELAGRVPLIGFAGSGPPPGGMGGSGAIGVYSSICFAH